MSIKLTIPEKDIFTLSEDAQKEQTKRKKIAKATVKILIPTDESVQRSFCKA